MEKINKRLIVIFIIIIIILSILCVLLATGIIKLKSEKINNENLNISNQKEYDAEQYVSLEDVIINSKVSTKKVKLQNLDDNITKDFYIQQDEVIDSIGFDIYNAEYKLKYFMNDNILSILYTIEITYDYAGDIETCLIEKAAVTNIDLKNNRVIPEEELLKKGGISYNSIVEQEYEKQLDSWKKRNEYNGKEISNYDPTFADFKANKSKHVEEGVKKIPSIIYTYIEDGQIKYDYYSMDLSTLFYPIGKGGCFKWLTNTLGEY